MIGARPWIETHQVWLYLLAAGVGIGAGLTAAISIPESVVLVPLGVLLYATFVQVPILHLRRAATDSRYLAATLLTNFGVIPAIVWGLGTLTPLDPAIRLGLYMVLLVPCTDWFIVFTHLGGGETRLAIASTPAILLAQLAVLPLYLRLFMGEAFADAIEAGPAARAFVLLILLPLAMAAATQRAVEAGRVGRPWLERLGRLPVPCLAVVIALVAASQVPHVVDHLPGMGRVTAVFVVYLGLAGPVSAWVARRLRLAPRAARTLAFSAGTRNSFVVLPFALALPAGWEAAAPVIVLQSLVELLGMLAYLRWVPRLIPGGPAPA